MREEGCLVGIMKWMRRDREKERAKGKVKVEEVTYRASTWKSEQWSEQ